MRRTPRQRRPNTASQSPGDVRSAPGTPRLEYRIGSSDDDTTWIQGWVGPISLSVAVRALKGLADGEDPYNFINEHSSRRTCSYEAQALADAVILPSGATKRIKVACIDAPVTPGLCPLKGFWFSGRVVSTVHGESHSWSLKLAESFDGKRVRGIRQVVGGGYKDVVTDYAYLTADGRRIAFEKVDVEYELFDVEECELKLYYGAGRTDLQTVLERRGVDLDSERQIREALKAVKAREDRRMARQTG